MVAVSALSVDIAAKSSNDLSQSGRGARPSHGGPSGSTVHNFTLRASGPDASNHAQAGEPANERRADQQRINRQSEKSASDDALFVSSKNDKDHYPDEREQHPETDKGCCKDGKHRRNKPCVASGKV